MLTMLSAADVIRRVIYTYMYCQQFSKITKFCPHAGYRNFTETIRGEKWHELN